METLKAVTTARRRRVEDALSARYAVSGIKPEQFRRNLKCPQTLKCGNDFGLKKLTGQ